MFPESRLKLEIVVDDRERASGLAEVIRKIGAHPVATRRLAAGDVAIGDKLVIERKEAADFVSSILDGRLERQLHELTSLKKNVVLILEGVFSVKILSGMASHHIRQIMLSIELDWRIPLLRAKDLQDTARWIVTLADRERFGIRPLEPRVKPASAQKTQPRPVAHRPARRPVVAAKPEGIKLGALRGIPGIGNSKALLLLHRFGSMHAILAASESDLASVEGIGPTLARTIRSSICSAK